MPLLMIFYAPFLRTLYADGGVVISAALIVRIYADLNKEMRSWS